MRSAAWSCPYFLPSILPFRLPPLSLALPPPPSPDKRHRATCERKLMKPDSEMMNRRISPVAFRISTSLSATSRDQIAISVIPTSVVYLIYLHYPPKRRVLGCVNSPARSERQVKSTQDHATSCLPFSWNFIPISNEKATKNELKFWEMRLIPRSSKWWKSALFSPPPGSRGLFCSL